MTAKPLRRLLAALTGVVVVASGLTPTVASAPAHAQPATGSGSLGSGSLVSGSVAPGTDGAPGGLLGATGPSFADPHVPTALHSADAPQSTVIDDLILEDPNAPGMVMSVGLIHPWGWNVDAPVRRPRDPNDATQKWTLVLNADGTFQIKNRASGQRCLNAPGDKAYNFLEACSATTPSLQWRAAPVQRIPASHPHGLYSNLGPLPGATVPADTFYLQSVSTAFRNDFPSSKRTPGRCLVPTDDDSDSTQEDQFRPPLSGCGGADVFVQNYPNRLPAWTIRDTDAAAKLRSWAVADSLRDCADDRSHCDFTGPATLIDGTAAMYRYGGNEIGQQGTGQLGPCLVSNDTTSALRKTFSVRQTSGFNWSVGAGGTYKRSWEVTAGQKDVASIALKVAGSAGIDVSWTENTTTEQTTTIAADVQPGESMWVTVVSTGPALSGRWWLNNRSGRIPYVVDDLVLGVPAASGSGIRINTARTAEIQAQPGFTCDWPGVHRPTVTPALTTTAPALGAGDTVSVTNGVGWAADGSPDTLTFSYRWFGDYPGTGVIPLRDPGTGLPLTGATLTVDESMIPGGGTFSVFAEVTASQTTPDGVTFVPRTERSNAVPVSPTAG